MSANLPPTQLRNSETIRCLRRALADRDATARALVELWRRYRSILADARAQEARANSAEARLAEAQSALASLQEQWHAREAAQALAEARLARQAARLAELESSFDRRVALEAQQSRNTLQEVSALRQRHADTTEQLQAALQQAHAAHDSCLAWVAEAKAARAKLAASEQRFRRLSEERARESVALQDAAAEERTALEARAREAECEVVAARETLDHWALRVRQSKSRELVSIARAEKDAAARADLARAESAELREGLAFVSRVMSDALRSACGRAAPVALRAALSRVQQSGGDASGAGAGLHERMAERLLGMLGAGDVGRNRPLRLE